VLLDKKQVFFLGFLFIFFGFKDIRIILKIFLFVFVFCCFFWGGVFWFPFNLAMHILAEVSALFEFYLIIFGVYLFFYYFFIVV